MQQTFEFSYTKPVIKDSGEFDTEQWLKNLDEEFERLLVEWDLPPYGTVKKHGGM